MMKSFSLFAVVFALAAGSAAAAPTSTGTVNFKGTVNPQCMLQVKTETGAMTTDALAQTMDSTAAGGSPAEVHVVSTTSGMLGLSAPMLIEKPTDYAGSPVLEASYKSASGALNQAWTASDAEQKIPRTSDVIFVNGRASDPNGFAAGDYVIQTVLTCAPL